MVGGVTNQQSPDTTTNNKGGMMLSEFKTHVPSKE